jgi:hypothetical protein
MDRKEMILTHAVPRGQTVKTKDGVENKTSINITPVIKYI